MAFASGIRKGAKTNSNIVVHKSTLLAQLGNIAQPTGRTLNIDPKDGNIPNDKEAENWKHEYAGPGTKSVMACRC